MHAQQVKRNSGTIGTISTRQGPGRYRCCTIRGRIRADHGSFYRRIIDRRRGSTVQTRCVLSAAGAFRPTDEEGQDGGQHNYYNRNCPPAPASGRGDGVSVRLYALRRGSVGPAGGLIRVTGSSQACADGQHNGGVGAERPCPSSVSQCGSGQCALSLESVVRSERFRCDPHYLT